MNAQQRGQRSRKASLDGYHCPYCKTGLLEYDPAGLINICQRCGGDVVTEVEWERRRADQKAVAATLRTAM